MRKKHIIWLATAGLIATAGGVLVLPGAMPASAVPSTRGGHQQVLHLTSQTEQFSVIELAQLVKEAAGHLGYSVEIQHYENPRVEKEQHHYSAAHTKLLDLGLKPHLLSETLIESMFASIERHKDRVITDHILPRDRWRPAG